MERTNGSRVIAQYVTFPFFIFFFFLSQSNDPYEWLQVDFKVVKRVTGIVTQGAKSLFTSMMVTEFSISVSDDGHSWAMVIEPGTQREKVEAVTKDGSKRVHMTLYFESHSTLFNPEGTPADT